MNTATLTIDRAEDHARIVFAGAVLIDTLTALQKQLRGLGGAQTVLLDLGAVDALDTAGAWMLIDLSERLGREGISVQMEGISALQSDLIATVRRSLPRETAPPVREGGFVVWLEAVGRNTAAALGVPLELVSFLGEVIARIGATLIRPRRLRLTALVHHMQEVGLNAVPIVALMAFLIGVVLAFQGAAQLRQFGAEVFVVDLIAISVFRELGILLTAIVVAGRSSSAFTASIGSMKMREEIDAMRTLSLDPIEVLVLPRVLALVITLPLLGFVADLMGLLGGALMSWIELGVSPGMFRTRLLDSVDYSHFVIGIAKAPFFALIIGIIGCYQGMKVEGNAESLGRLTSKSVVLSIFLVIVLDALFSIFFASIGV